MPTNIYKLLFVLLMISCCSTEVNALQLLQKPPVNIGTQPLIIFLLDTSFSMN